MKTRQSYEPAFKKEIAEGYYTRKLTAKDIEAKGLRMNNVYRWVHEFFGAGARAKAGEPAPETPTPAAERATATLDIHTLSRRKIKRGANGRYPDKVKDTVMSALLQKSVPEVSEITGINSATLYLWKNAAQKTKEGAHINGSPPPVDSTALVPTNGARQLPVRRAAEVLVNPETTEGLLDGIRKMEGFSNLSKTVENKLKKFKAGVIDFDEDDHRLCMAFLQITGGKPPARTVRK